MRLVFAKKDNARLKCALVSIHAGLVYKCGICGVGVVADEPGGLRRANCLRCGARITQEFAPKEVPHWVDEPL